MLDCHVCEILDVVVICGFFNSNFHGLCFLLSVQAMNSFDLDAFACIVESLWFLVEDDVVDLKGESKIVLFLARHGSLYIFARSVCGGCY